MIPKQLVAVATVAAVAGGGVALAGHVTPADPATVPYGFLAAHTAIADVPVHALKRAARDGTELSIQHVRLDPNAATPWHTHPGPGFVAIQTGALTYEDASYRKCRQLTFEAGSGFVDEGFGHVHRAVAGPDGADFYVAYVHPPGSETHVQPAAPPEACTS